MVRSLTDRFLTVLAHLVLRGFFRSVEIQGRELVPAGRPLLIVANHAGGFVDPVMLMWVFGRLPRFLAKATLWRPVWVRPLLWVAGLIPVHRPQDGTGVDRNAHSFDAAEEVLLSGGMVGIFPEGRTHDEAAVTKVHTGAARIALGAYAAGVRGLAIVAVGLTFDDKIAARSRVLATVGTPIDLDEVIDSLPRTGTGVPDERDHRAVRRLTEVVAERLRSVAPGYESPREARVLAMAAEIRLRPDDEPDSPEVTLADRERMARRLAHAPAQRRAAVADALAHYLLDLHVAGLREEQISAGHRAGTLARSTVWTALIVTLLLPLAAVGVLWNAVPYLIVTVAGRVPANPVSKGTARLIAALAAFPLAWSAVAVTDPWPGAWSGVAVFLLAPVLGLIAIWATERATHLYLAWRGWVGMADRRALVGDVRRARDRVEEAVDAALHDSRAVLASPTTRTAVS